MRGDERSLTKEKRKEENLYDKVTANRVELAKKSFVVYDQKILFSAQTIFN